MKLLIISSVILLTSLHAVCQEQFDEYITIYREDDFGDLHVDSMLECVLKIQDVQQDMTMVRVEEITGKASKEETLSVGEKNIVYWYYIHEEDIMHSIEFFDGNVRKVIMDYPRHQKELEGIIREE